MRSEASHSFFLFDIQSMRSTACVKVQIIWICTSRWSGSIMNTARNCPLSRSMYLNIQRKYLRQHLHLSSCISPLRQRDSFCLLVFVLQLVWTICHHVVGWKWRSVQRFSPWSSWKGQKRRGNFLHMHPSVLKSFFMSKLIGVMTRGKYCLWLASLQML